MRRRLGIDVSGSVDSRFDFEQSAASSFLEHTVRAHFDKAFVINDVAALTRLASDDALCERLAAGGRARAAELSWARIAPRYVTLYRRVAHA